MHQQVRVSIRRTSTSGPSVALDEGSLVDILTLLQGKNLRSGARMNFESGGEFVFSVRHARNDDTADQEACDILNDDRFQARLVKVREFLLDDREGALLRCIRSFEVRAREPVIEVHVGAPEPNGKVPVQLVTRTMLNS
jgi:hypothetical protein